MAIKTYAGNSDGALDNTSNYAGGVLPVSTDSLIIENTIPITAQLDSLGAVALDDLDVYQTSVASIGAAIEPLEVDVTGRLLYDGRGPEAWFKGDIARAIIKNTGTGTVHLDTGAGEQLGPIDVIGSARVKIEDGADINGDIIVGRGATLEIGAGVTFSAGDLIMRGGTVTASTLPANIRGNSGKVIAAAGAGASGTVDLDGLTLEVRGTGGAFGVINNSQPGVNGLIVDGQGVTITTLNTYSGAGDNLASKGSQVTVSTSNTLPDDS